MKQDFATLFQSLKNSSKEPGDLPDILQRVAKTANKYFLPDLCVIFPMNPITGEFLKVTPTHSGEIISYREKFDYPSKSGLTKKILKNKILAIQNISKVYSSPKVEAEKIKSVIGIGLYTKRHEKPLAVMYLDYRKTRSFSREFQNDLRNFAEIASSELQTTWFIRRYREMAKIGQDINENFDNIQQLFDSVYDRIKGILDVSYYISLATYDFRKDKTDLYLVDEGKQRTEDNYTLQKSSVSAWVLHSLEALHIGDFQKEKLPVGVKAFHVSKTASRERSGIFVPIDIGDIPLGVLSIQHPKIKYYDEEDKQILELLANHIALALYNYRLFNDLKQLDASGQVLTTKLVHSKDIVEEVSDRIFETTQADLITLYPYQQSKEKYFSPIHRGNFYNSSSTLRVGEATPAAIVHKVNNQIEPIFAVNSPDLYRLLDKNYEEGGKFPDAEGIKSTAALPLRVGTESIGVLFVNFRTKQRFDLAQQWVIRSLSTYAAIAIRNSRQYQDLRDRRISELNDLRKIDKEISKSLRSEEILKTILDLSAKYIKADTGLIILHNKKLNALEPRATLGDITTEKEKLTIQLDKQKGIANIAFKEKRTIRISNVRKDPEWKDAFIEVSKNTLSEMDIPLILDDVAIGVMNFESSKEDAFSEDDQEFMETLAGQAVIVVRNAIEYERAQRIAAQRKTLIEIVNTLLSQDDRKVVFKIILEKALEITKTSKGTISNCDAIKRQIEVVAENGLREGWSKIQSYDDGIVGLAVQERRIINIGDISKHQLSDKFLDAFPGDEISELVVPIYNNDQVIGVINLESENPYHFEEDDVELVSSLSSLCAVAIKNAENIEQKRLADVAYITGDLSHKMKSPLSKIQRQIELIEIHQNKVQYNDHEVTNRLKQIAKISSDATDMVQKTLDEAKMKLVSIEKTSLKEILRIAITEVDIPKTINIENKIEERDTEFFTFATPELANVFHNLITNSINAIPESKNGYIYIEIEKYDENWIIISFEDNGIGISKYEANLVFQPISSSDSKGRGFGLALTKSYIEMIGGKIDPPTSGRDQSGAKFLLHFRRYPADL